MWFDSLRSIESRGSRAPRPGSLAGLAAARKTTLGQFFTPPELVNLIWRIVTPAIDAALERSGKQSRVSLLDSSCGVGAMFWPADPSKHRLYGIDVDAEVVDALTKAAEGAGFQTDVRAARLEQCRAFDCAVGLLNPPFGLNWSSPAIEATPDVTTWGRFGRHTSAMSHSYAIAQALQACQMVVAVVPRPFTKVASRIPVFADRLHAIIDLPAGTFKSEGTAVQTALLVFGSTDDKPEAPMTLRLRSLSDELPAFALHCDAEHLSSRATVRTIDVDDAAAVITLPVTGDNTVHVAHDGRKVVLGYRCGWTQARVQNTILRDRLTWEEVTAESRRLPTGVKYKGEAWLDLEHHLIQPDPRASFQQLIERIESVNATAIVDPGVWGYLNRRIRRDALRRVPMQKTVYAPAEPDLSTHPIGHEIAAMATCRHMTDPDSWTAKVIAAGTAVQIFPTLVDDARQYCVRHAGKTVGTYLAEVIHKHYQIGTGGNAQGWHVAHAGRWHSHPQAAQALAKHARKAGLDKILSWEFQFADAIELALSPRGVCGWAPALGKSRLAWSLCAIHASKHNLVVCEARLVDEMVEQFKLLNLPADQWQVIRTPNHARDLRRVNIISYERLRREIAPGAGRLTYARLLRRKLHTVVADEAGILRNRNSEQSKALWMLSPKRRYALDGTPLHNYAQDGISLLQWAADDGRVSMPYGRYTPYVDPNNLNSMLNSRRGMDVFRDRHITLEWCTNQWAEDCRSGARRQVPMVRNIEQFRALLAPHILRRVTNEPDVAQYVHIPEPKRITHKLEWDRPHLAHYLQIADEFAAWYRQAKADADANKKALNLVTVLARIGAVQRAVNEPANPIGKWPGYYDLTSKHRAAIDLIKGFTAQGRKTIVYAHNPGTLARLGRELQRLGISHLQFHGKIPITQRNRQIAEQFKNGDTHVLLSSFGVVQRGLNLPMASRGIFYDREWTPDVEDQAGRRMLRSTQTSDVEFHFLEIEGSIDSYQAQMVAMKSDAINAALDYSPQISKPGQFLHIDTILGNFVNDLATRYNMERQQLLDEIRGVIRKAA